MTRAFADMGARHHEIVDVEIVIVLRIRNGGFQALADVLGDALAREFQIRESCLHLLAADELGKQVEFLRADAQHAGDGFGLVAARLLRGCPVLLISSSRLSAGRRRTLGLPVGRNDRENVRVGANSPSLWPTISSVTSTGMCLRPLWTPKVSPTNCGRIVERRLQVLITSCRPDDRAVSAFFSRKPSTNGPFPYRARHLALALLLLPRVAA